MDSYGNICPPDRQPVGYFNSSRYAQYVHNRRHHRHIFVIIFIHWSDKTSSK